MSDWDEHRAVMERLQACVAEIEQAAEILIATLKRGGKVLLCGNGGSASDCQHIAAEFVVRYRQRRRALPAIALTTDTSILTAHVNDFEFETVFSRQLEALGAPQDCLIAISTSGQSRNIIHAAETAHAIGMPVLVLAGCGGGKLAAQGTVSIVVPSEVTARIQEAHILIGHWWCATIEQWALKESGHAGSDA
jgi:D-sedoheptulose 7-phosphate isomerase